MSTKIKKHQKASAPRLVASGVALLSQGKHPQAEAAWRQAAEVDPQYAPAWSYLTEYLALSQRSSEALRALDRLISVSGRSVETLYELADKCAYLKQYPQARQFLADTLHLHPPLPLWLKAALLRIKIDFTENDWFSSVAGANAILRVQPDNLEALQVRQRSYFCLGWTPEDVADCRTHLALQPDADRHHRLLFKLNCLPSTTPELLYEESRRWNEQFAQPLSAQILPHTNVRDPDRRLRIGYVSADFRHHAIMRLLPGVLENHDKLRFEIFAYSIDTKRDDATELAQKHVDRFVELPASTIELANRVRRDSIDILMDLGGHSLPVNALLAFGLRPAPVQLTWMGTLATTGMNAMDYFLGDEQMPCPGTDHLFSEKVYRLPRIHACYRPLLDAGLCSPPFFTNGYITFGSFNDPKKIGREVVKVWALILHLHPGSKLLLKSTNLEKEQGQHRFREWFLEDGISAERLCFEGAGSPLNFQQSINKVDIALDPFPYNGGTTTLELLWMGVPVVSLAGRTAVNRCGVCLLSAVGLPVTHSLEQYVALAGLMAKAVPEQPNSRAGLRATFNRSQLRDELGMTRALEAAYRDMWRIWCSKPALHPPGGTP